MDNVILVRGAGDLATGIIVRLNKCGFDVVALEIEKPLAIRRQVAFSEAVYDGYSEIEGVTCRLCETMDQVKSAISSGEVALLVDEVGSSAYTLKPRVVIDAILAKKNLGTNKNMAKLTIGLGPGFTADEDVHIVIETMRGHNLGKIISCGKASENTGIPGTIKGFSKERVIYSNSAGIIKNIKSIGDVVKKSEIICSIIDKDNYEHNVVASIDGIIRGMIRDNAVVKNNLKIADIDPREGELSNTFTISDKARCISGSVLEVIISNKILPKKTT